MLARLAVTITLLLAATNCFAYSGATFTFLMRPPSSEAFARGNTYSSYYSEDPLLGDINPAAIGFQASRMEFSTSFFQDDVKIASFGGDDDAFFYSRRGLLLGFSEASLQSAFGWKMPLSLGVSFHEVDFDLPTFSVYSPEGIYLGEYDGNENAKGMTIAGALHYDKLKIALGVTGRYEESELLGEDANNFTNDFGVSLLMNLHRLGVKRDRPNLEWAPGLEPLLLGELSYAYTNLGDEVSYIDRVQGDPMPRTGRLDLGLTIGLRLIEAGHAEWNLLMLSGSIAASDELVDRGLYGDVEYLGPLGKIHLGKDLIMANASEDVTQMRGLEIGLVDLLYIRRGTVNDPHYFGDYNTSGYSMHLRGIFRMLTWGRAVDTESFLGWVTQHVDLAYYQADWDTESTSLFSRQGDYQQIVLSIHH